MPNINIDCDYFDHPKTRRLVGLLGKGADVLPIRLWAYCGRYHAEDGKLEGYAAAEIEAVVSWGGKPGEMVAAMVKVGFLEKTRGGAYIAHDFGQMQGHIAALKVRGKNAAEARWARLRGDASSNAHASAKQSSSCTSSTVPAEPEVKSVSSGLAVDVPVIEKKVGTDKISAPASDEIPDKKATRPQWAAYTAHFRDRIMAAKNLDRYDFTAKQRGILAALYDQLTPQAVMALWDLFWMRDQGWSDYAVSRGHSIDCFGAESMIQQLLDAHKFKDWREVHAKRLGMDAASIMGQTV